MRVREVEQDVENYLCVKIRDDDDASNYSISVGAYNRPVIAGEGSPIGRYLHRKGSCDASGVRNASANER